MDYCDYSENVFANEYIDQGRPLIYACFYCRGAVTSISQMSKVRKYYDIPDS